MKNRELNSIKQEVKYLRENGLEVVVDYDATKQDVLDAFTDQEARMIVISGHGKRSAMIQTSDDKRLTPYDLKYINVSKNLETVIFENCHQGDYISDWKKELPKETNVIGWRDKTSVLETKRFNGLGWFDRQPGNLQDQANKIVNNYLRKFK
ncbi:MAG: caspase family protein [Spirochaetaceae bacterium]